MQQLRKMLIALMVPFLVSPADATPGTRKASAKLIPISPIYDTRFQLKAGIEHSDKLAPAPEALQVGARFDEAKLSKLSRDNTWYQIPEWYAGTWRGEEEKQYYEFEYATGEESTDVHKVKARSNQTIGWQQDKLGGVWEYCYDPYLTTAVGEAVLFVDYVTKSEPLYIGQDKVVMRFQSIGSTVGLYSRRVLRTSQEESIQTYTPVTQFGFLKCESSCKSFNAQGEATKLYKAVGGYTRIMPFTTINYRKGVDLRSQFKAYLTKRGLTDRIP